MIATSDGGLEHISLKKFIDLSESLPARMIYRLRREVSERLRFRFSILSQSVMQMLPGERRFIHPLRHSADLVIRNGSAGLLQAMQRIKALLNPSEAPAP